MRWITEKGARQIVKISDSIFCVTKLDWQFIGNIRFGGWPRASERAFVYIYCISTSDKNLSGVIFIGGTHTHTHARKAFCITQ